MNKTLMENKTLKLETTTINNKEVSVITLGKNEDKKSYPVVVYSNESFSKIQKAKNKLLASLL